MSHNQTFRIAQREHVEKRVRELNRRSDDIKSRLATTLKKLWVPERPLAVISNLDIFQDLRIRFPNFTEALDIFEANAIGLAKYGLPFEASPILLHGEPGLGKTLFASELGRVMGLPYFEISMATMTASFALSGGSIQWSEGGVGFIANSLADSSVGNPIFLIDEIDKQSGGFRYNPISPFYSLLEQHSAKKFKDEALEIELDASKVIWIATANYLDSVPEPILSRMRIIDIVRPNEAQMRNVVMSIYAGFKINKPYGQFFDPEIPEPTMERLVNKNPREARIAIDEGCLKAISDGRSTLLTKDLPVEKKEKQHVGFI